MSADGLYRQSDKQKKVSLRARSHRNKPSSDRSLSCHRNVTELSPEFASVIHRGRFSYRKGEYVCLPCVLSDDQRRGRTNMTIGNVLAASAARNSHKIAIALRQKSISYQELDQSVLERLPTGPTGKIQRRALNGSYRAAESALRFMRDPQSAARIETRPHDRKRATSPDEL